MDVKGDIIRHKRKYGVDFDDNLYVSLMLGAIAKRHILVSSSDMLASEAELQTIIRDVWGLKTNVLNVKDSHGVNQESLLSFFAESSTNHRMDAVYLIVGIDKLHKQTQTLILEIMRSKNFQFEGEAYLSGELFMLVGVTDDYHEKDRSLFIYLQDEFWFKQPHDPRTATLELKDRSVGNNDKRESGMVRRLKDTGDLIPSVVIVPEMKRYIYDIIIFVRTHRCVATGLPGRWISEMELLSKALCVIFNKGFVIPSIIKLAARKLLPPKIRLIRPENESSLQWGSDPDLVHELMKRITPQLIIEDVLRKVGPPV